MNLMNPSEEQSLIRSYYFGPNHFIRKRIQLKILDPLKSFDRRWDFTIEYGNRYQSIRIQNVVWSSDAYRQGMRPGDEILSINGFQFDQHANLNQALQILNNNDQLDILVQTLRVNHLDATSYYWFDPIRQCSTSPPPGSYLSLDTHLPYQEIFVEIQFEKEKRLGLVIRGGLEYGLGIFISSIDQGSLSEQSGLCVGDQILSVNQIDFRHRTHQEAVEILRNSSYLKIHLRRMNKLPMPKDPKTLLHSNEIHSNEKLNLKKSLSNINTNQSIDLIEKENSFKIDPFDKRSFSINDLIDKYHRRQISIDYLIHYLFQRLKDQDLFQRNEIFDRLRKFIRLNDLDRYDISILKQDFYLLKLSHRRLLEENQSRSIIQNCRKQSIHQMSKSLMNLNSNENKSIEEQDHPINHDHQKQIEKRIEFDFDHEKKSSNILQRSSSIEQFDLKKSKNEHNYEQFHSQSIIENFLKDYSLPYQITIHKVCSTLGIAIEGGYQDRIPLPRIVYIQPDGSAYLSSGLRVGHVILEINGTSMKGLTHRQSALLIANSFKDKNRSSIDLLVVQPLIENSDKNHFS